MNSIEQRKKNTHWIQSTGISKNKGALHRSLGVPAGDTIPLAKLTQASKGDSKLAKRARLAMTLRGLG